MFIGADTAIHWCLSNWSTSIEGSQGSGKTSLAFMLAIHMLKKEDRGFRYILSNVASDITDNIEDVIPRDGKHLDCIIIYDEIGKFIKKGMSFMAENLIADLRKLNVCLLLPTRQTTAKELRSHIIEADMNFGEFGIDLIHYKCWLDRKSSNSKSDFWWINTKEIKGYYDSNEVVEDSNGIMEWFQNTRLKIADADYQLKQASKITYMS